MRRRPNATHMIRGRLTRGRIELTVEDARGGEPVTIALTASGGGVAIEEDGRDDADARITASTAAWVRAFTPAADRSGLKIEGDQALATRVLDALAPQEY